MRNLRREFRKLADPLKAPQMQAYMKSAMPYHGVSSPLMRQTCRALFCELEFTGPQHWSDAVLSLWRTAKFREERYAAIELSGIKQAAPFQLPSAIPVYEEMIVSGAWWDYVDALASHRVGPIVASHPREMKLLMSQWSKCDDLWKRRTSILCQLSAKHATDLKLLYDCIEPSLGEKEFFLRKAIG